MGESALPIYDDLNAIAGQEDDPYDLNASLLAEAKVVPLRVRVGDDASCLNLNKAIRPTLYGVNTDEFKGRFSFAEGNWSVLDQPVEAGVIPAVVDQNTMMWALKMKTGDRIELLDGEGRPFLAELVGVVKGSMLQGALYLSEKNFLEQFPKQGGYRAFFLQEKPEIEGQVATHLEDRLSNYGMEFSSTGNAWHLSKKWKHLPVDFSGLGWLGIAFGDRGTGCCDRPKPSRKRKGIRPDGGRRVSLEQTAQIGLLGTSSSWILGLGDRSPFGCGWNRTPALFGDLGELPGTGFLWFFIALLLLSLFWTWLAVRLSLPSSRIEQLRDE